MSHIRFSSTIFQVALLAIACHYFAGLSSVLAQDWLIDGRDYRAGFVASETKEHQFVLGNGLVEREFFFSGNKAATVGLAKRLLWREHFSGSAAEAMVEIDGIKYEVGGLRGQPNHAYFRDEWLDEMTVSKNAMSFVKYEIATPSERFAWKRTRHHAADTVWPPAGVKLTLEFKPQDSEKADFRVFVHYELLRWCASFCKWITVENRAKEPVVVDRFTSEILAVVEHESRVESRDGVDFPVPNSIHVETDFAFGGFIAANANRHIVHWRNRSELFNTSQLQKRTPCLLVVEPDNGPAQTVKAGGIFASCRAFELLYDSEDRERRSLSLREMYRTICALGPLRIHLCITCEMRIQPKSDARSMTRQR